MEVSSGTEEISISISSPSETDSQVYDFENEWETFSRFQQLINTIIQVIRQGEIFQRMVKTLPPSISR